jgi:glycosyltransferase involved in cell wall biosynthesis
MATGMPCIATDYSATTEFINDNNCFLLKNIKKIALNKFENYSRLKGNWVEPDKTELKQKMRFVYENYKSAFEKAQNSGVEIKKRFWRNSANKLLNYILELN